MGSSQCNLSSVITIINVVVGIHALYSTFPFMNTLMSTIIFQFPNIEYLLKRTSRDDWIKVNHKINLLSPHITYQPTKLDNGRVGPDCKYKFRGRVIKPDDWIVC